MVVNGIAREILQHGSHFAEFAGTGRRVVTHLNAKGHRHLKTGHVAETGTHAHHVVYRHTHFKAQARRSQRHPQVHVIEEVVILLQFRSQLNVLSLLGHLRLLRPYGRHDCGCHQK